MQPMVPPGVACVVELVEDPAFGPVVGFGLGGVATELLGDRAWRAVPLTDRDADRAGRRAAGGAAAARATGVRRRWTGRRWPTCCCGWGGSPTSSPGCGR